MLSRADGYTQIIGDHGTIEQDTIQCGHCGIHYTVQPGSGKHRSVCLACCTPTCGGASCIQGCRTIEQRLEQQEARNQRWVQQREQLADQYAAQILSGVQYRLALLTQQLREQHDMREIWGV